MTQIRTEWLKTFLAAVETGTFTAAAERVHRSQSAVSLQVAQLEQALGQCLLMRGPHGLHLLPAGEHLLPYVRQAIDAVDAIANAFTPGAPAPLRLGFPEEYADGALPGIIAPFSRAHPDVQMEVICATSAALEAHLNKGDVDVVLGLQEEMASLGEPVVRDPTIWVGSAQAPLAQRDATLPVAVFDMDCTWRRWALETLERASISYRIVYSSSSVAALRAAIRAGIGVGLMGASTMSDDLRPFEPLAYLRNLPASNLVLLKRPNVDAETIATLKNLIAHVLSRR